jgi:hypothetical protein
LFHDPIFEGKKINLTNIISIRHNEVCSAKLTGKMVGKHMSSLRNNYYYKNNYNPDNTEYETQHRLHKNATVQGV